MSMSGTGLWDDPNDSPVPSSPARLLPQHRMLVPSTMAQVWSEPHATSVAVSPRAPRAIGGTLLGTSLSPTSPRPPLPSLPSASLPQQRSVPSASNAHE